MVKGHFLLTVAMVLIVALLSCGLAPRLAQADVYCCCLFLEPNAGKAIKCQEVRVLYSLAVAYCSMRGYFYAGSSQLRSGRCCIAPVCPEYPCGTHKAAEIQWWHEKDFEGETHRRDLYTSEYGQCLRLVHNDAMKSIKFRGMSGQTLEIFDDTECGTDDDWGILTFPASATVVSLPKIGRQGEQAVSPRGAYRFHYHNGLPGKVSAIRLSR